MRSINLATTYPASCIQVYACDLFLFYFICLFIKAKGHKRHLHRSKKIVQAQRWLS